MAGSRRRLVAIALVVACGGGSGDEQADTGGTTGATTAGASATEAADGSSTSSASLTGDTADTDTSETGEPPPPPDCDGIGPAVDELGTTPGEASLPSPTLEHLTAVWTIEGDTNENGTVTVRWREQGGTWHEGTPLRRVPAGSTQEGYAWTNKHAGTVFGLAPGTAYDVELYLSDPDGGCEVRTLQAATRPVPAAMAGAPVIPVDPDSFAAAAAAAMPGDVLELAAGSYATFTFPSDGTLDAPIVIRAAGAVVIEGEVRLDGRSYVIVEGLEVHGQI